MQLKFTSVKVQDQEQALRFYTEILALRKWRISRWRPFAG